MTTLSSQSYKGSRDLYPDDKRIQNYIFSNWKKVSHSFGYEEYGAPLIEPLEVYAAKSGQELASEQTYAFDDRGGRRVAIRPEMTPSISRMVAARRQELGYPARLFSIANFMRYERPQRGREREFWQLNVDIFGADTVLAEAEIISMGAEFMNQLGARSSMYTIRINSRKIIDHVMSRYLKLDMIQSQLMIKLFDRKAKINSEEFRDQALDIFGDNSAEEGLQRISRLLTAQSIDDLPDDIKDHDAIVDIQTVFSQLEQVGITNARFDVTLMRGLDYYTGIVFEFFDSHPDNARSLFGGGRYDGLVGLFGAEPISAVGMAPGLTMTQLFLETHTLLPTLHSSTELVIIPVGSSMNETLAFSRKLRSEGVNVSVDFTDRKLEKRTKAAIKLGVPFVSVIGEVELESERYKIKDTLTGNEQTVSFERLITTVKDRRRHDSMDLDLFDYY